MVAWVDLCSPSLLRFWQSCEHTFQHWVATQWSHISWRNAFFFTILTKIRYASLSVVNRAGKCIHPLDFKHNRVNVSSTLGAMSSRPFAVAPTKTPKGWNTTCCDRFVLDSFWILFRNGFHQRERMYIFFYFEFCLSLSRLYRIPNIIAHHRYSCSIRLGTRNIWLYSANDRLCLFVHRPCSCALLVLLIVLWKKRRRRKRVLLPTYSLSRHFDSVELTPHFLGPLIVIAILIPPCHFIENTVTDLAV